jgi:hypothetical protein
LFKPDPQLIKTKKKKKKKVAAKLNVLKPLMCPSYRSTTPKIKLDVCK